MGKFVDTFETHRWRLFFPVFVSFGISVYYWLSNEPSSTLTYSISSFLLSLLVLIFKRIKKQILSDSARIERLPALTWSLFLLQMVMCFIVGFCAATIRTNCVRTPAFPKELLDTTIRGVIESIEDVPRGTPERQRIIRRIILADIKLPSKASNSPKLRDALNSKGIKIRLQGTLKKLNKVGLFSRITLRAHIFPPPFPLTLHGYDAPFDAYFKGISAFGKLKEVHKCANDEPPQNTPLNTASATNSITQSTHSIQKIRFALKQRIETFLNPRTAPIANALIVGDKSGITLRSRENFTKSGLSHILAISGLHMGLLSLMIFFMLSKVLALVPNLAEMFPVKKLSALLTIPVALFYLLLSGGSFSAMRSFIMVCISMIAILVDENPISLHCIAIAALIILLLYPESLYSISFQLSFASVFGLCSFHEKFQNAYWGSKSAVLAKLFRVLNPIQQSILSTFIATIATAPIIVYSFQRFTFVGAIGNLLAIPLLSFFIMPVGILATISLIWGGSGLLFRMFNISLDMLINITERVASLPFSDCLFAKPSCVSVILIILSIIWLVVWNESKRLWSIPFLLLGLVLFFMTTSPSIFITHNVIGISPNVRRDDGFSIGANDSRKFLISSRRFGGFHAKVWAQECGLKDIDEMTEEQVEYWQERLEKAQNSIAEDEVIFMWQDRHGRFSAKTLSFVGKNRPWYALARKD